MIDCGFSVAGLDGMEIIAICDPCGVIEVVIFSDVGYYAGSNIDGWNSTNSLVEIGELSEDAIDSQFGVGASALPIWQAAIARS